MFEGKKKKKNIVEINETILYCTNSCNLSLQFFVCLQFDIIYKIFVLYNMWCAMSGGSYIDYKEKFEQCYRAHIVLNMIININMEPLYTFKGFFFFPILGTFEKYWSIL